MSTSSPSVIKAKKYGNVLRYGFFLSAIKNLILHDSNYTLILLVLLVSLQDKDRSIENIVTRAICARFQLVSRKHTFLRQMGTAFVYFLTFSPVVVRLFDPNKKIKNFKENDFTIHIKFLILTIHARKL